MKVAMLVPSLEEKGPLIVALNIAKYNQNPDITFLFVSLRKNTLADKQKLIDLNINFYEVGMGKFPTLFTIYQLYLILRSTSTDIIHAHCFWPMIFSSFLFKRYKLVVTLHNNPYEDYEFEYGKIIGRLMASLSVKSIFLFNEIVAISQYVKDIYANDIIKIIYNSIEDIPNVNNKDFLLGEQLHVISVSVLSNRKNIETALKSVQYVKQKGKKIKYIVIGSGVLEEQLKALAQSMGINENVEFMGKIDRDRVIEILDKQDVMLFPSISEGLGLAAIEAMMKGIPVVSSNIPVMDEIIDNGSNGFMCDTFDEKAYGDCLLKLYDISLLKSVSLSAREKYLKLFKMDYMIKSYSEVYYHLDNKNKKVGKF